MLVGVISDSHDNVPKLHAAVELLRQKGAQHLIHAGDYVALFAVKVLTQSGLPFPGVFGNNDGETQGIHSLTRNIHLSPYWFALGDRRFVIAHDLGKLPADARGDADVIVFGHTHQVLVEKGPPLLLNPGECCGWVTGKCTVTLLDTESLDVSVLEV